ncbi:hypothetical protein TSUD_403870 [Trifolium subterraneum]|uniref:Uncharacterized protein n=1 Tax=Trifolium subterraneum TaxID=3900 RepID=A0A2Z6NV29_TRISU|nr:hypothetical protein TSUD_403870 [Trifolium subterraneum]
MWKATEEDYSVEPAESIRPLCTLIDVGLVKTTTENRIFGALKGALDGATFLGSPSPGRGGRYEECVDEKNNPANAEETAFDKATCCSRKKTRQADGWTSSDDEAETVEQIDEAKLEDPSCSSNQCRMEGVRLLGQAITEVLRIKEVLRNKEYEV